MPDEAYDGKAFLLDDKFYVLGGQKVSKTNGLASEKSKQIWTFNFKSREWTNGGKMGLDIRPYKTIQKDSLFYLIGHPSNTPGDLILDLQNNRVQIFDHTLISANTDQKSPAFFKGDTLYYTSEQTLHKSLAFRDIFVNQSYQDRLFLNEITLFWNITYLAIAGVFLLAYISFMARRNLPICKRRDSSQPDFLSLVKEEQQILRILRQNLSASTEELMRIFSKHKRSFSQTHKLKADAIDNINKLITTFVGEELIKIKKDPKDKRQLIYYYKRNILH